MLRMQVYAGSREHGRFRDSIVRAWAHAVSASEVPLFGKEGSHLPERAHLEQSQLSPLERSRDGAVLVNPLHQQLRRVAAPLCRLPLDLTVSSQISNRSESGEEDEARGMRAYASQLVLHETTARLNLGSECGRRGLVVPR